MNYSIYKNKKVFITGHTGFKGTWMISWLHNLGAVVKGYALAPERSDNLYNLVNGDSLCDSVIADIRDENKLRNEILSFEPDYIFHLAAQPLVRESYNKPLYTYETNVMGTANLLHALRSLEKPCVVVVITTDKVYENKEWELPYAESDRLGGFDPYSSSKACCEIVTDSFRNSFYHLSRISEHGKVIATTRAGNVIGGGDRAKDRIIPDIIHAVEYGVPLVLRNPRSVRPWQHVLEPISGYLMLGEKLSHAPETYSGAWNFGPHIEDCLTVQEIAEMAADFWPSLSIDTPADSLQPHEANLLKLNISKAITELGWSPQWNASKAIHETFKWYSEFRNEGAYQIVLDQINRYSVIK